MMRSIDPERIRPAVKGKSDKFSWRLYRWMKRNGDKYPQIITTPWNCIDGDVPGADPHDFKACTIYAGRLHEGDSDILGANLKRITCGDGKTWAFSGAALGAVDITEWFWSEYLRIGRCLIHGDLVHEWRYDYEWDRTCRYCGKRETMQIKTRIERDKIWSAV